MTRAAAMPAMLGDGENLDRQFIMVYRPLSSPFILPHKKDEGESNYSPNPLCAPPKTKEWAFCQIVTPAFPLCYPYPAVPCGRVFAFFVPLRKKKIMKKTFSLMLLAMCFSLAQAKVYDNSEGINVNKLEIGDLLLDGALLYLEEGERLCLIFGSDTKQYSGTDEVITFTFSYNAAEEKMECSDTKGWTGTTSQSSHALKVTYLTEAIDYLPRCIWLEGVSANESILDLENSTGSTTSYSGYKDEMHNFRLHDRTLYRDGRWQTLCLPFAVPKNLIAESPLAGAEIQQFTGAIITDDRLQLSFSNIATKDDGVKASVPYLVRWTDESLENVADPVFQNVVLTVTSPLSIKPNGDDATSFVGVFAPVTLTANDKSKLYLGGDNKLYYPATDVTVYAFRAYFELEDGAAAAARFHGFELTFDDGTTTGVMPLELSPAPSATTTPAYNLGGIMLPTGSKGLQIKDGKKVIVK